MRFRKRKRPADTSALHEVLRYGTYEEFLDIYDPRTVLWEYEHASLLTLALANSDFPARLAIANHLLDDGADVTLFQPLHVLVGRAKHDFVAEAPLVTRMLDLGADVNEVTRSHGTPLETAACVFKHSDETLQPFYDAILARPDLDLLQPGLDGRPVLVNLRKWAQRRGSLVTQAEQLLTSRRIPLPAQPDGGSVVHTVLLLSRSGPRRWRQHPR